MFYLETITSSITQVATCLKVWTQQRQMMSKFKIILKRIRHNFKTHLCKKNSSSLPLQKLNDQRSTLESNVSQHQTCKKCFAILMLQIQIFATSSSSFTPSYEAPGLVDTFTITCLCEIILVAIQGPSWRT